MSDTDEASRRATTAVPIHDLLAERWSPRSFNPTAVIDYPASTRMDDVISATDISYEPPAASSSGDK